MRKLLLAGLAVAAVFVLGGSAGAVDQPTVKLAYDQKGNPAPYGLAPVKYKHITEVYETLVTSNSALLMGIIMSSVNPTTNDFITFRDTNSANGSGTIVVDKLMFLSTSTSNGFGDSLRLPHPIQFGKGITVQANKGAAFSVLGSAYTVLYLENR